MHTTLTYGDRISRLRTMVREGRIVRRLWVGEKAGRETACLLAALSPEAGRNRLAISCPVDVMPAWLAHLTPSMDDCGTAEAWAAMVQRYADVASRWRALTDEDWRRLDYAARAVALRVALPHAGVAAGVVHRVLSLCERAASGEQPLGSEWDAAGGDAAWSAATDARDATNAARSAAHAATSAATDARDATNAARSAARSAADAAASAAASAAAWDTITDGILSAIEDACAAREVSA